VSALDLYSIYTNLGSGVWATPRCVHLWVDEPSLTCPDAHNPPGLDKILRQGKEQVLWVEMNEPTYDIIPSEIDRVRELRYGYRWLIGATHEGPRLLRSDLDKRLPLAAIVPIQSDRDVCIWSSVNTLGKPMDLPFYGHRGSALESGTDSSLNIHFTRRHNRCPSPDASQSSDDDSLDSMNPEQSTTAAKRAPLSKTTTTKNGTRNT